MAQKLLESSALSAFCGSIATMLSAGIQTEEAVLMLAENRERSRFQQVCNIMYQKLVAGETFSAAMAASEGFPRYAVEMAATGEQSGHLEQVLRNLELYYDEEDRMFNKLRSSVGYPAALLVIMAVILLFTVLFILPVFANVYQNMAGSLASQSFASIGFSTAIGWVAFAITVVMALIALYLSFNTRNEAGRARVMRLFEKVPLTSRAMYQLALSRFTAALATFVSSGITNEEAMTKAIATVEHDRLHARLVAAREGYEIRIVRADMTLPLPFEDGEFDLIFHPVSNCYIKDVKHVWRECFRILKKGGTLLSGTDHYVNYIVSEDERSVVNRLPFDPLVNKDQMEMLERKDCGVQFSHTIEEQINGQLEAGFVLKELYEDTNGSGWLHELHIPTFLAMRSEKPL